jgi:hypothetical protein
MAGPLVHRTASKSNSRTFPPVGLCIYCGSREQSDLSLEHILPQGLGGGLRLPASSCECCRKVTQAFETASMRHHFLWYRITVGLVQKPKELPKSFKVLAQRADGLHEVQVPLEEIVSVLILPELHLLPGMIRGGLPGEPANWSVRLSGDINEISAFKKRLNASDVILTPKMDELSYFRMLAKISHGWTISQIGIDGFEPLLPEFIVDPRPDLTSWLLGKSDLEVPVRDDAYSHQLGMSFVPWGNQFLAAVRLRLCAAHLSPAYTIIAGPLTIPVDEAIARARANT